jgi:hypothetical protein
MISGGRRVDNESVAKPGLPERADPKVWKPLVASLTASRPKAILVDMIFRARRSPDDRTALEAGFVMNWTINWGRS